MTNLPPIEWHTEQRKVLELVPYNYNPRKCTPERLEKLKRSLEKFNLAEIPAINTDNIVIAGHQRIKVLMELDRGDEVIDVRVPNRALTEQEFKEYNITSNVSVGYWDMDILEEIFADIDLLELGLDVDNIEIPQDIIPEELKTEEENEDELDVEPPAEPISKLGDLYEFRSLQKNIKHRLLCGDSTLAQSYNTLLRNEKYDLIVTDPPYNVNYEGGTKDKLKIKNDSMDNDSFYKFLLNFYTEIYKHTKEGGSYYIFHADTEGANFRRGLFDAGFKLSQCLIWLKNGIVMSRQDYHWKHEPILYGWKTGASHQWYNDRKQTTILEFDKPLRNADHPTMKPLDLIKYLLKNSSQQGDIIGDSFLGSGSTLIASEQTWRNCYGIELDERYADVIVRRWVKYVRDNDLDYQVLKNGEILSDKDLDFYFNN
ncbi:MAG: DNA modification methylase [Tenacibaculum sp.]|nr:DNA modification methylase [Tenacibaculum sp.]